MLFHRFLLSCYCYLYNTVVFVQFAHELHINLYESVSYMYILRCSADEKYTWYPSMADCLLDGLAGWLVGSWLI